MSSGSDSEPRQRFGGSRARSGCVTCKRRRVKCGEEQPNCLRCVKGKRACEGYVPVAQGRRNADGGLIMIMYVSPSQSPSPLPGFSRKQQRSFEFFRTHTAAQFAGPFSSDLWSKTLPRLSHQEDAIRHAIVAIGALHEAVGEDDVDGSVEYAMQQYGKAINEVLALDVSGSDAAADTALIACVLFAAFESMQGHYKSAMTHSSAGLKILREQEMTSRKDVYLPRHLLKAAFMQLDTQSREMGDVSLRPILKLPWEVKAPPAVFDNIDQAKEWLEEYIRDLTQFLTSLGASLKENPNTIEAILQEHARKKELYQAWCAACRDIDAKYATLLNGTPTPAGQGYLILQIWRITIKMLLEVDLNFGELAWDSLEPDFATIVSLTEKFVRNAALMEGKHIPPPPLPLPLPSPSTTKLHPLPACNPTHTFSTLGIITPLFLTATRCRTPLLRRSAVTVLRACGARSESLWNARLAALVCERIIALEEEASSVLLRGSSPIVIAASSQVPLEARILGMDIAFGPERQCHVRYYRYSPRAAESVRHCQVYEERLAWGRRPLR